LYDNDPKTGVSLASLLSTLNAKHPLSTFHWSSFPGKQRKMDSYMKPMVKSTIDIHLNTNCLIQNMSVKKDSVTVSSKSKLLDSVTKKTKDRNLQQQQSFLSFFNKSKIERVDLTQSNDNELFEIGDSFNCLQSSKEVVEGFKAIMKSKSIPECKHGISCCEFACTKKGINKGRKFYKCSLELKTQCNFFLWKK
jgi:hypothetical protein